MEPSDLAALATLDALLQEESVTGAGRRLGLSTPALSHALARLRERFDDPLLVRAGRKMVLTPRAVALRPRVHDAVAHAAQVYLPPEDFDPARLQRRFRISTTDYLLLLFGRALDEAVGAEAPGLALQVIWNGPDDARRLRDGELDLAIGVYQDLPPELRIRKLFEERFVCVVREGHPRVKKRLSLEQYSSLEHVQVAFSGKPGGPVDDLLAERGLARTVVRSVPYFRSALELVAGSDRILTISERLARQEAKALGLRVLAPPLPLEPYTLSMVWHPRYDGDAAHAWLRGRVLAAVGERTASGPKR